MKRYIKSGSDIAIEDLFTRVGKIVIVDDASKIEVNADTDEYDLPYLSCSEDVIKNLTDEDVECIFSVAVLQRIYEIAPEKLTKFQCNTLGKQIAGKHGFKPEELKYILNKLKSCKLVDESQAATSTKKFLARFGISKDVILETIHNLNLSDFENWTQQADPKKPATYGDTLIVAYPHIKFEDSVTHKEYEMKLYLKIDFTLTTKNGSAVFFMSFHRNDPVQEAEDEAYKAKYGDYRRKHIPEVKIKKK